MTIHSSFGMRRVAGSFAPLHGAWGQVFSVVFSPTAARLRAGAMTRRRALGCGSGRELRTLTRHSEGITSVEFSPNSRTLASSRLRPHAEALDVKNGREIRTLTGHTGIVVSVAFSPNGRYLLSCGCAESKSETCTKGSIKLWVASTGKVLHEFTGSSAVIGWVAFSPDSRFVLSDSDNKTLKLWDVSEWTQPQEARR